MTYTVTLPRSVVEQALEALNATMATHGKREWIEAAKQQADATLRSALEQPQDHSEQRLDMVPADWKLVPVAPTSEMIAAGKESMQYSIAELPAFTCYNAMLRAAPQPPVVEQQYPLPDDLYGGSKDWRAGSYHERVEWLHLGYEAAKKLIAELEQPLVVEQPQPQQLLTDLVRDAFFEGFTSVETYNDTRLNSVEEAWAEYKAAHGIGGEK